jgi:hypothetical protein
VSILSRRIIAAGLAVATVGSLGVASTLNAGAAEVTAARSSASSPVAALDTPPPRLPGGGTPKGRTRQGGAASATGFSAFSAAEGAAEAAPLDVTPEFAPKGLPSRTLAKAAAVSKVQAQTLAAPAPSFNFLYAQASQAAASDGTYATMTIARPALAAGDYHSLAEIAAQSADGQQVVEVGWTVDRNINGDDQPHLFVYHWVDRKETCYNACGFVQYSMNVRPGTALPVGTAKRFGIQHFGGSWWVMYDNEWIGYFPDSIWGGRFTRTGLAQWFGEVAAARAEPCTEMGTGVPAAEPGAAEFRSINFINGPAVRIATGATSPYYTVSQTSTNAYRYGGAGAC